MKMKHVMMILLLSVSLLACDSKQPQKPKILILVSNTEHMGDPEKHFAGNNLWEVAPPYHVFVSHGYEVDFASPTGGEVPFSMDPMGISSYAIKYEGFMDKVKQSLKPEEIDPASYQAVFIYGGYGPLFDLAQNEKLLSVIAAIYENGGVVGGCGHGPGGFANAKAANGDYLVKGKRITAFPNATEVTKDWAMQGSLLPFLVEDQLRRNGAQFLGKAALNDKHEVVTDQRIVTTMFLPSAALVAKEMLLVLEEQSK